MLRLSLYYSLCLTKGLRKQKMLYEKGLKRLEDALDTRTIIKS